MDGIKPQKKRMASATPGTRQAHSSVKHEGVERHLKELSMGLQKFSEGMTIS